MDEKLNSAYVGSGIGSMLDPLTGGIISYFNAKKRPTYNINPEVEQNKALAQGQAFGQNAAITQGMSQADQTAAQDINTAQQYSSNAGTILNVLKSINNNRNQTKQNLTMTDSQLRNQGMNNLMGANNALSEEKDKAWNYNVNEPYQLSVQQNRDMGKARVENFWKLMDFSASMAASASNAAKSMGGAAAAAA